MGMPSLGGESTDVPLFCILLLLYHKLCKIDVFLKKKINLNVKIVEFYFLKLRLSLQ